MARSAACIVLSLILLICSVVAASRGLASLYAYPGKSSLAVWREGKHIVLLLDWKAVRASLAHALSYDGGNPDLLQSLGAAHDAEVAFYPPADTMAGKNRDSARQFYLESLARRPTWPHNWIALALVKYRQGEIDEEFYRALHLSLALGPWEPGVLFLVADIGMHHWEQFDEDTHRLVLGAMHAGMQDNPMDMVRLAQRYDMLAIVCNFGSTDKQAVTFCEKNLQR